MKKILAIILSVMLLSAFTLTSCQNGDDSSSPSTESEAVSDTASEASEEESSDEPMKPDENAKTVWQDSFADADFGITSPDDVYDLRVYNNGLLSDVNAVPEAGDVKYIFAGTDNSRIINFADGYMLSMNGSDIEVDLSLAELRVKYTNEKSMLTVSKETSNPYGVTSSNPNGTEEGWEIYLTEWLNRYLESLDFLEANNINRTRKAAVYTDFLPGYTVMFYDMFIRLSKQIERPYYNIAIVREDGVYSKFWLFVMKSTENCNEDFDAIIKSFCEIDSRGEAVNLQGQYEMTIPQSWNEETKAYYEKLCTQTTCDWGMFVRSMPSERSTNTESEGAILAAEQERLSTSLNYDFEIMPTYMHIGWGSERHYFPLTLANEYAGGNGFNGKPVLQFTYQFTTLNNTNLYGYTPMFDIIRGSYDKHFRKLAQDIKAYGKPVLFRLNNEMDSDWTSYCGMLTLLDPDIFIMTWQRLYDIFVEEGVDNCIWIFNPLVVSCPYSSWGEALNYMPGEDYVQVFGLTAYEMANGGAVDSFKYYYQKEYNKYDPYFDEMPWIISEFACGSGGEQKYDWGEPGYVETKLRRNENLQAKWVKEMFDCFEKADQAGYEFVAKIKGAVWFCVNDYCSVNGKTYILNNLRLDPELTKTLEEFRKGLERTHTAD